MHLLLPILLTALLVNGLQIATAEGMLLNFIKKWLDKFFIEHSVARRHPKVAKLYYPILYCVRCMPSVYGIAICLLVLPLSLALLWQIPVVVLCSVCVASIINSNYV